MRKSILLLSLVVVALSLNSCFNNLESHTTPQIMFGHVYVNPQFSNDTLISAKDTLLDKYNYELGLSYLDTMQLGDTVMFNSLFSSDMNNLVNITASFDTVNVQLWFGLDVNDEKIKNALASGSRPEKGVLNFNPMYNMVTFPIYIVPQKTGVHAIKITVTSDSKYPTNSAPFMLPVK